MKKLLKLIWLGSCFTVYLSCSGPVGEESEKDKSLDLRDEKPDCVQKKYKAFKVDKAESCEVVERACVDEQEGAFYDYCAPFPLFELKIPDEALAQIHKYREEALASNPEKPMLGSEQKKYVDAILLYQGKEIPIEVRLKGDYADHFRSDKLMSLRVKMDSESAYKGMRKFSIQRSEVRSPLEAYRHALLKDHDVLSLRYFYVSYRLNGEDLGIMSIEEHFSHELLEFQQARESPILAVNEDYLYNTGVSHQYYTPLKVFKKKRHRKDPVLDSLYRESLSYFRGFKEGHIKSADLFDMEKMAKFSFISNLLKGAHGMGWQNLRFYFNPFVQRFEPVAYDAIIWPKYNHLAYINPTSSWHFISESQKFYEEIYQSFETGHFDKRIEEIKEEIFQGALGEPIEKLKKLHHRHLNDLQERLVTVMSHNLPKKTDDPYFSTTPEVTQAHKKNKNFLVTYYYEKDGEAYLEFINRVYDPVTLLSVILKREEGENELIYSGSQEIMPGLSARDRFTLRVPSFENQKDKFEIEAHDALNPEDTKEFKALYYAPVAEKKRYEKNTLEEFLERYPMFKKGEGTQLHLPSGEYRFLESLYLPRNYSLILEAGTILSFASGVSLNLDSGGLLAHGTREEKIIFKGLGTGGSWAGLRIAASGKPVVIENAFVQDLFFQKETGLGLTGAISIYEADVKINHLTIGKTEAEDALNLVKSTFAIKNLTILSSSSDAIDVDWGVGSIKNSTFHKIAGDAIDVSGTQLEVENTLCQEIGDKALSIGEKSQFKGYSIHVQKAGIGIASKDYSEAHLENSFFEEIENVAFAAYVKKAEYGPSSLFVKNVKIIDSVGSLTEACEGCLVSISD